MSAAEPQQVVVVGGGLAGLAAAEALTRSPGVRATLVEPTGRVGGILATRREDGWLVERSADSFLTVRPEAVALVERIGLANELIGVEPRARRALVLAAGRPQPVPAGFRLMAPSRMRSVLSTPLLSVAGRMRVLAERFVRRRGDDVTDESLEHFAVRRLGREAFERLVQPLAAGIWTADPARLSMAAACPEFFAMERQYGSLWVGERRRGGSVAAGARYGQFATIASGMETLPRRLIEQLEAGGLRRITAAATGLSRHADGSWRIELRRNSAVADGEAPSFLRADAVILAVPAPIAASLLTSFDPHLAGELGGIEYAGSAVVSLGFARSDVAHPLDAAGLVIPRREGCRILAVSFSSEKFPGRAPPGAVLLRTFVGGALDPEAATLDEERLLAIVREDLRRVLGAAGQPRLCQVDRWTGAMPQYTVGHLDRVARIERLVTGYPGLALAGAAYGGVGIPQVLASGQAAAARVIGVLPPHATSKPPVRE